MQKKLLFEARGSRSVSLRPWRLLVLLAVLSGPVGNAWAQTLTGTKTIGVEYATLAAAITALNAQGVGTGGVTFNVPAGYAETFASPTAGAITATGTSSSLIVFQKSGTGANPVITAGVGTSTTADAIISLNASDYVTFNGLSLVDPTSNVTATTGMEFGFLLGRTGTGATLNGCNNNSIVNCSITLQRAYTSTSNNTPTGIFQTAGTVAVPGTVLSPTGASAAGQSSNNSFLLNTIQNVNTGIYLQGAVDATPYTNYDQNNSVGSATSGTGNTIQNFGGAATAAYGVRLTYQNNVVASNNTVANVTNGGVSSASTLYGIYLPSGTNTTSTVNNNTITLVQATNASQVSGIYNGTSGTGALTINGNTFNLTSTASTGTFYNCYNSGSFTTTGATVLSFSNNTIAHTATGAASNTFYGFYNSGTIAGTTAFNGNSFLNAANTLTSTGTLAFWYNSNSSTGPINMASNQFSLNRTGASGTVYGYYNASSPTGTHNFSSNTFSNITLAGTANFYGFYVLTSSSQLQNITTNTFNSIAGGSGSTYGMYIAYGLNGSVISGNTITNLSGTGTTYGLATGSSFSGGNVFGNTVGAVSSSGASSVVYGMYLYSATNPVNWYNNKVYNISESGATGAAYGMYVAGGTTNTIYNNLVGNITAPTSTSLNAAVGLFINSSATVNAYYNTIYLNASSTGATFGTSGVYLGSTTSTLTMTDNIIVNTSTAVGTGGYTAAFRRVSGTAGTAPLAANYATASNNNLFWAGTPSAANLIYVEGITTTTTNPQQTLATYQAFMGSPRDAASKTENPPFLSTTGTAGTFLHINTVGATQVESGGIPISGITTDFDGDTRNATTPDIGADEGAFTPNDQSPPAIAYTGLGSTASTANRTLVTTITDASGVATGTGAPRLYYRKGTSSAYISAAAATVSGSTYTFTIDYTAVGGVVPTDVIQYYVAAQDASINNNTGTSPSGGSGINPPGSVAPGTPNSYTILPTLAAGTYYVGTGTACGAPTYATLTAAAAAYNGSGLGGAITFVLVDNTYPSETYPIVFNANGDASATNTLTIKPCSSANPVFSGTSTGALIQLNGAQYVTLDGSNNGTTSQSWSLTNSTGSGASLVQLVSNATGVAPASNTVKNLVLTGAASATTFTTSFGIQLAVASPATTGASNNTFQNNAITKVQTGISAVGLSTTVRDVNTTITGNQVGSATAAAGFGGTAALGITASNQNTLTITGNVVRNPVIVAAGATATGATALISSSTLIGIDLSSNVTTAAVGNNTVRDLLTSGGSSSSSPLAGVRLGGTVVGATVNANLVTNLKTTATGGYGGYGIYVNTGTATAGDVVSNNMVSDINGSNFSSFTGSSSAGIYLNSTQSGISVVYNSVNMYGTSTYGSAVVTAALAVESGSTGLTVRNNVLANSIVGSTTGSLPFSLFSNAPAAAYTVINNNDYYSAGTQATDPVIFRINGTNGTTLAALKVATAQDAASISATPAFTTPNDLHTGATALNAAAAPVAGITVDFDGQTRDATTPDIGADEFTPPSDDAGVAAITQPVAPFSAAVQNIAVQVKNYGAATLNTVTVNYTVNGTAQAPQVLTGLNLASGATSVDQVLGTFNFAVGGPSFVVVATTSLPNGNADANTANDSFTRTVTPALCGTYAVGVGQAFATLDAAVASLNAGGASCAVTFTLTDATYPATSGIIVNQYPGNNATNTLTIKPAVGISPTITGSVATGAVLKLNGVQYVTIDGSNNGTASRNLTLTNTSATGAGNAVLWVAAASAAAGSSFNTVKNTLILGNSGAGYPQYTVFVGSTGTAPGTTTATPAANSNNTFTNNVVAKGYYGVIVLGVSTTVLDQNNTFSGNQIGQSGTNNGFGLEGMRAVYQQGLTVQGNEVQNVTNTVASYHYGLNLQTVKGAVIDRNSVHDVLSGTTSSGYPGIGIEVANATHTTVGNASANQVSNNLVYNISAPAAATSANPNVLGIACNGGYGDRIQFNTVLLNVAQTAGTGMAAALSNGDVLISTATSALDVRNNIVALTANVATAATYYGFYTTATSLTGATFDYNDYFLNGTGSATFRTAYFNSTAYATLANWQAISGQEANTKQVDPTFTQTSTVPFNLTPAAPTLNSAGVTIAGITADYNGATRTSPPDIGAIEFTPSALDIKPVALLAPSATQVCFSSAEPVSVQIQNNAAATVDFSVNNATVTVVATPPSGTAQTFTTTLNTGTLAPGATQNVTLASTLNMSAYGTYTFAVGATVTGDGNTANDNLTPSPAITTAAPVAGTLSPATYSICQSGSAALTLTGAANGTIQYQSSPDNVTFTDIAGATAAAYTTPTLTSTTYYRAQTRCGTNTATSNTATITVNSPAIASASASPSTLCSGNTSTLTATGSTGTTVKFFAAATGGTAVATGTAGAASASYTTPALNTPGTVTYYAQASTGGTETVGKAAYTSTAQTPQTGGALYFTTTAATTIQSVTVYLNAGQAAGTVTIDLRSGSSTSGTVVNGQSTAFAVPANATSGIISYVVPLNYTVPAAGSYTLYLPSATQSGLLRDNAGYVYPYTSPSGTVSITAASVSSYYYYFYNWVISSECAASPRTAISINVTAPPTFTIATSTTSTTTGSTTTTGVCAGGSTTVTGTANPSYDTFTYAASPSGTSAGISQASSASANATLTPTVTTTYTITASSSTGGPGSCQAVQTLVVNVNPQPVIAAITATPATVCLGSSSTLQAAGTDGTTTAYGVIANTYSPYATPATGVTTLTATSTPTSGTNDDGYYAVNLPFAFSFFGTSYAAGTSSLNIGTNGILVFGTGSVARTPYSIPSASNPGNLIAGDLRDLYLRNAGTITYFTTGTAPNRVFVVSFNAVEAFTATNPSSTFQLALFEGTNRVDIISTAVGGTSSQVQGIQNSGGTVGYGSTTTTATSSTVWSLSNAAYSFVPGTSGLNYQYALVSGDGLPATTNTASISVTPSVTSVYSVAATNPSTGCAGPASNITVTVTSQTTYTGTAPGDGNNWFNAANWTACVPSNGIDAIIPTGLTNYPSLSTTATAAVRTLTIASGASLAQSAGTLNVYGNLTSSTPAANVTLTGGAIAFLGSMPTITGISGFYNLTINLNSPAGNLTMSGNATVNHALTLTQGVLNTGTTYAVTLPVGATVTESDASYVLGRIAAPSRNLSTATAETFGGMGLTLTPNAASGAFPGLTNVVRTTGTVLTGVGTSVSIKRYFDIVPATNTGLNVTMSFSYLDHERNGVAAGNVALFKSVTGTSGPWANQTPITITGNSVSKSGITGFSVWTLGSATTPLPVELSAFDARRQDNDAALTWATASEKSNRGFEVQVSTDGHTFRELGFVAGAGTSSAPHAYAHLDREASKTGLRYYRLRQLDFNGTATFSPVRIVAFGATTETSLSAVPNPFATALTLVVQARAAAHPVLTVTDAQGRTVLKQEVAIPAGRSAVPVPGAAALPTGFYLLHLSLDGESLHVKAVKH